MITLAATIGGALIGVGILERSLGHTTNAMLLTVIGAVIWGGACIAAVLP